MTVGADESMNPKWGVRCLLGGALMGLANLVPGISGGTMLLAAGIYAGQVLFASLWLKWFKQGPIEWLWRCLTAKKFSSILR